VDIVTGEEKKEEEEEKKKKKIILSSVALKYITRDRTLTGIRRYVKN
jgi:hypothetical protein